MLAYLNAARQNEQDHYDALAKVLGAKAPKALRFTYPSGTFASGKSIAATGVALETAFVGAYLGAVNALKSNDLKGVAGQIGANEAQHLHDLQAARRGEHAGPEPVVPEEPDRQAGDRRRGALPRMSGRRDTHRPRRRPR